MSVERMQAYAAAGASGAFVPCVTQPAQMRSIAEVVPLPLNVMWLPGLVGHADLVAAGVRRVSAGPALYVHAWAALATATEAMLGGALAWPEGAPGYGELNRLFDA